MTNPNEKIRCAICGHEGRVLFTHISLAHNMSPREYEATYPNAPTVSQEVWEIYDTSIKGRRRRVNFDDPLTVDLMGVPFPVRENVPESACLPLPPFYKQASSNTKLGADLRAVAMSLRFGRSLYVYGMPGTGKDAFFHAFSAMTRTPARIFQIMPGADIQSWFFSRAFDSKGTYWEEGELLKCLRDGYTTEDGTVVPYMILITDFDRATRSQAESLRLVLDSIKGRVMAPGGEVHEVMPGTIISVTANTAGSGDVRGRMVSANPIDGSIMDRFESKVRLRYMDWSDEEEILRAKFPNLYAAMPEAFTHVGRAVDKIRSAIESEEIYWELSHRGVENVFKHARDILAIEQQERPKLLQRAWRVVIDGAPDMDTREALKKMIDPHCPSGMLDAGDNEALGSLVDGF